MTITEEIKDGIKILHLHNGDANRENLVPIITIIGQNITKNLKKIIINMEEIKSIDSKGIGVLIAARALLLGISGQLVLAQPIKRVIGVIKIMGIYNKFIITETISDALQKF